MKKLALFLSLCAPLLALPSCAPVDDAPASGAQPIINGTVATSWMWKRAARISGCSATIIASQYLLTASHCQPVVGGAVRFYTSATANPTSHSITSVAYPLGVNPASGDYQDTGDQFADIAVVRLNNPIPSTSVVAEIARTYPGNDAYGYDVGSGRHDGLDNPDRELRYHSDTTYSSNPGDGHFLNNNVWTNPGDSGGPFYYGGRVTGVLYGYVFEWLYRNKYTNIPYHRVWVLDAINYSGPFNKYTNSLASSGSVIETFQAASQRECAYACEWNSSCRAWSYYPVVNSALCYLRDASGQRTYAAGVTTGERY